MSHMIVKGDGGPRERRRPDCHLEAETAPPPGKQPDCVADPQPETGLQERNCASVATAARVW